MEVASLNTRDIAFIFLKIVFFKEYFQEHLIKIFF